MQTGIELPPAPPVYEHPDAEDIEAEKMYRRRQFWGEPRDFFKAQAHREKKSKKS